jgi:alpha-tubulin suppressor-like RCC1 family protein
MSWIGGLGFLDIGFNGFAFGPRGSAAPALALVLGGRNVFDTTLQANGETYTIPLKPPSDPVVAAKRFQQISNGSSHCLAIADNGTLWSWGNNAFGQLGDGTTTARAAPVQVGFDDDWLCVCAARAASFAIKLDGSLWSWGRAISGILGDGSSQDRSSPAKVGSDSWRTISADSHVLAIRFDGTLWSWGDNTGGKCGLGSSSGEVPTPQQVSADTDWGCVSAGWSHSLAIRSGRLFAWGNDSSGHGFLGLGDGGLYTTPQQVGSDTTWRTCTTATEHSHGLKLGGTLFSWGRQISGRLGNGRTVEGSVLSPVEVTPSGVAFVDVLAGSEHGMALDSAGRLWVWGNNGNNGIDGINDVAVPTVAIDGGVAALPTGRYATLVAALQEAA